MPGEDELDRRIALLELTTDLVASTKPDGELTYVNAGGRELVGWAADESLAGKRITDILPAWAAGLIAAQALPRAFERGTWRGEAAIRTAAGVEIPVSVVLVAHRDEDGEVNYLSTIMRDITARKQAEDRVAASEENLRITLDSIVDAVIATDAAGLIVRCNPVAASLTGWPREAALGRPLAEVFRVQRAGEAVADPQRTLLAGGSLGTATEPVVLLARDGSEREIAERGAPIRDAGGEVVGLVLVFHDVTEQRRLEAQLRQSQKMESIGQLAGGIAHDFNNMLMAITGAAELLSLSLRHSPELAVYAQDILDAVDKAGGLTQKLLDFSRKGVRSRRTLDLHGLVDSVAGLLARTVDRRIRITTSPGAERATVLGDASQLQNLLLNLGLNARDAMPEGGKLGLTTRNVVLGPGEGPGEGWVGCELAPGPYVELEVRDTGVGIDPAVAAKVFEPFFTTKEVGAGTGLGLSAVYSAAADHGGAVRFDSEPGVGTRFFVRLPLAPAEDLRPAADAAAAPRGRGRILLVDDEEMIRNVTGTMLSSLGYEVLTAADGEEAVRLFARDHARIDLVLLDMVMPKMSGRETLLALREISAELAVLFSSGFTRESEEAFDEPGVRGFVKKPYRMAELARHVAEALAG